MVMPNKEEEEEEKLVYGIRLSSVVPGKVTGENKTHKITGMDLALKLHYLKGLYFFSNNNNTDDNINNRGNINNNNNDIISIYDLKKPMFDWLVSYFMACGRVRTSPETGGRRPVIKLNDAGIRIVEARSTKTVDEWLAMEGFLSLQEHLVYNHALGPDLGYTPLVFIQVTWFKCGGISVGLSWAHVLGDVFSATTFMNMLSQYLHGHHKQPMTLAHPDPPKPNYPPSITLHEPLSIKRVNPVGDHWVVPTNCKMGTHSFHLTSPQLDRLHSRVHGLKIDHKGTNQYYFEVISAIIWKSLAKIRRNSEPDIITICRPKTLDREQVIPCNDQAIGTVQVDFSVSKTDLSELVCLIAEKIIDESGLVNEFVEEEMDKSDFIVYGANLTFINMEEANVYGFQIKGQHPKFASYSISGVGEKGVILVLPGPKDAKDGNNGGKVITVVLPEDELEGLKSELKEEWYIM